MSGSVASRLRALRERSGLSRAAIGDALTMKPTTFQHYETVFAEQYLPLELSERIADVLTGKGEPPINRDEVMSLAGFDSGSTTGTKFNDEREVLLILAFRQASAIQRDQIIDLVRRCAEFPISKGAATQPQPSDEARQRNEAALRLTDQMLSDLPDQVTVLEPRAVQTMLNYIRSVLYVAE